MKFINTYRIPFYRILLIIGQILTCIVVHAQEIRGKVIDPEGNPVQGASVVVMTLPDSVFDSTSVTNEAGIVMLDMRAADSVFITVQMLGFERYQTAVSSDFTVYLEPTSTQLQEVVVEVRPTFRSEAGKFVFTPGDLAKRVNNAQDILQYVPMVRVNEGNISILGSPRTMVYVNGKPPRGMFADIKNIIKSLPPTCIKRIEVIKAPGASVEGSYDGAILNIVMVYPWEGFIGIVNATANAEPDIFNPGGSISLYYTKDKWSLGWSGACNTFGDDDKNENYYEYMEDYQNGIKSYVNNIHYRRWTNIFATSLTANYNFADAGTLGLDVGLGWANTHRKRITSTTYTTTTGEVYESRSAICDTIPYNPPNVSANLFYTMKTDDNGSNLDIVFGYTLFQTATHTGMFNQEDTLFQHRSNYRLGWGGKAEYRHQFSRSIQLKVGAGFNASTLDDALDFYEQSNRFIYKEKLLHTFGEISFPWHRTSFVVGLRVETEFNTGDVRTTGDSFKRNNTALLPGVSFDWKMPWHNQSLSASFTQRVWRPFISWLNPFRIWTTENSYTEGNPHLKNYYNWIFSLNYMCVKNIMFRASFFKSSGGHNSITLPDEEQRMGTKRYDVPGEYSISAGADYSKELLSFWNIDVSVGYSFNHSKYVCEGVKFKSIFSRVSFSVKSIFNFSKRYGLFGTVYYDLSSPFKGYNDTRGAWDNRLTVSARKDWKDCSLSLYASLIPLRNNDYNFNSDIYIAKYNKTNYGPSVSLSFRYIFGNKQTRGVKMRNAGTGSRFGS